jgi:hypothetical protein
MDSWSEQRREGYGLPLPFRQSPTECQRDRQTSSTPFPYRTRPLARVLSKNRRRSRHKCPTRFRSYRRRRRARLRCRTSPTFGEPPRPADVPADEAPHVVPVLVAGLMGHVPDINGLTADVVSSVAPMGVLVGATGEPGPKPSGDVKPSGGRGEMLIPPTCA